MFYILHVLYVSVMMVAVTVVMTFVLMAVVMHMDFRRRRFFFAVHQYMQMSAAYTAFFGSLGDEFDSGDAKSVKLAQNGVFVLKKVQQRGADHIARRAHSTVYVKSFHFLASMWFIWLAQ
jgi:hypothetical protein